jgi:hypothetical protein
MATMWTGGYGTLPSWSGSTTNSNYGSEILKQLDTLEKARTEQVQAREKEVRSMLDQIIGIYGEGGKFGQGTEAMLNTQKKKDVASGTQALVSSGLSNTTTAAGLGQAWESSVGMPARAKLEDVKYGALAQAIGNKAQFVTDIQNQMPDYNMIANLIASGQGVSTSTNSRRGYFQ